jgi:hypothetical protein
MDADLQAAIAIGRATLRTLAALSPVLNTAADAALEEEAKRCARRAASQHTLDEARMVMALERALVDAANALPAARVA